MPTRRPPYLIPAVHAQRTANHLRELADRAERGELIGVAVTAWTSNKVTENSVAGIFDKSAPLAYWSARKLCDALLHQGDA
jgi:hypothetical protein